jgi:hypothetical protein
MPRFVLLYHACPPELGKPSHWDFMLERDGVLLTWNLANLPAAWSAEGQSPADGTAEGSIAATRLPDHRLAYLTYEGPLTDNRGHVIRRDDGDYRVVAEAPGRLTIVLKGRHVQGVAALRQVEEDAWDLQVDVAGDRT